VRYRPHSAIPASLATALDQRRHKPRRMPLPILNHSLAEAIEDRLNITGELKSIVISRQIERRGVILPGNILGCSIEAGYVMALFRHLPLWSVMHCLEHIEVRAENGVWTLDKLF